MFDKYIFTKRLSFKRFFNLCLLLVERFLLRRTKPLSYPLKLVVDPCSICNMNCVFCSAGEGTLNRSKGKMDPDNLKDLLDECGEYIYTIDFFNWGAPFLNESTLDMISYASSFDIKTRISSTLTEFDENQIPKLFKSGLDELIISINGVTPHTYEKHHGRDRLSVVLDRLKKITDYKKQSIANKPEIIWQFMVTSFNEEELEDAEQKAKEIGCDTFKPHTLILADDEYLSTESSKRRKEYEEWLPAGKNYNRYENQDQSCNWLWTHSVVNWDGSVSPCCGVDDESMDFGNAFEKDFRSVWRGEKYRKARKAVLSGKDFPGIICSNCAKTGFQD